MQQTLKTSGDIWFDPSGYYVVALTTLLLCILIALYFANFLKDDPVSRYKFIYVYVRYYPLCTAN